MKRFIFYICAFFIIVPVLKMFTDTLTDNTTGIIYLAAENMTIYDNATGGLAINPTGNWLLVLWQAFPWGIGAVIIFELFRWIGGRKRDKNQQQLPWEQ